MNTKVKESTLNFEASQKIEDRKKPINDNDVNDEIEIKTPTLQETSYKFKKKIMMILYILLAIIGLIISASSISMIVKSITSKTIAKLHMNVSLAVIVKDHDISSLNFSYHNDLYLKLLHHVENNIIDFDICLNETFVWIEESDGNREIRSTSKLFSNNAKYIERWIPHSIACDFVTGNLYIIDKDAETINVIDVEHKYRDIVLSDLQNPHDIILDPTLGVMFILQERDSILKANMDGSSVKEIVRSKSVSAFTIDRTQKRIIWATNDAILNSNYNGKEIINWKSMKAEVLRLAVYDSKLYWLSSSFSLNTSNLHTCKIVNGMCQEHLMFETVEKLGVLKSFPSQKEIASLRNPCKDNFYCEQLCLLSSDSTFNCSCKIGYILSDNMRTCKQITSYFVFARSNYFYGRTIDHEKKTFIRHEFSPVKFDINTLKHRQVIEFEQSWLPNEILFCDDRQIYTLNTSSGKQMKIFRINNGSYIENMAVDQNSKNLYYTKIIAISGRVSLQILTIKNGKIFNKHLTDLASYSLSRPYWQFAVCDKYIFHATTFNIERIFLNGKREMSIHPMYKDIVSFALDCERKIIYVFEKNVPYFSYAYGKGPAFKIDLSYQDYRIQLTNNKLLDRIEHAYFHDSYLYISDFTKIKFFKDDMSSGPFEIIFYGNKKRSISRLKVFQFQSSYDDCKILKSLDCQQFCFSKPTVGCACEKDLEISDDVRCV